MNASDSYLEAARAYADGVRVLFAPMNQEAGQRGGRGPVSYTDLADQAERLAPPSGQFTEEATARLAEATPEGRMNVETALLTKAATDLEVSSYLLQAAQDEEAKADFGDERRTERSVTTLRIAESYLKVLLGEDKSGPGQQERGGRRPRNVNAARAELTLQAGDTLASILERSGQTGGRALEGLIALGAGEAGKALGAIGLDIANWLGQAEKVTRLYTLFRGYLIHAYDSLVVLLGPKLIPQVGDKVKNWMEEILSGEPVYDLLERLYQTQQTRDELNLLIRESNAALEIFVNANEQISGLNEAFQKQTDLVDRILSWMKYLTLVPAAVLPQGKLLLAAVYVVMCGYVILVGGDYADARRLDKLDRVPGVRRVVETNLAQP